MASKPTRTQSVTNRTGSKAAGSSLRFLMGCVFGWFVPLAADGANERRQDDGEADDRETVADRRQVGTAASGATGEGGNNGNAAGKKMAFHSTPPVQLEHSVRYWHQVQCIPGWGCQRS